MIRQPKGSYTRSTPDWFAKDFAWCPLHAAGDATHFGVGAFYNDTTSGNSLHIYGINFAFGPAPVGTTSVMPGFLNLVFQVGVPQTISLFNFYAQGSSVYLNQGAQDGQTYNSSLISVLVNINGIICPPTGMIGSYDGPLYVLQPGNTIYFFTPQFNWFLAGTIWYLPIGD